MDLQKNIDLKPYNTFGISSLAEEYVSLRSISDVQQVFKDASTRERTSLILGGGSNMLLTRNIEGLVAHIEIDGIDIVSETDEHIDVEVGAGVNWHQFVMHCVANNWAGIENLSLIPGNVGASPMQNIGAYGVEVKDLITSVQAIDRNTGDEQTFNASDCEFGYRTSIFKTTARDQFVITRVGYRLQKTPKINTSYGAIEQELERLGVNDPGIADVSKAVINIRSSKLPDPKELGNAGSFFKNPIVSSEKCEALKEVYPDVPHYAQPDGSFKIAAGWLIEQCGWKGKKVGNTGAHAMQSLVLVNYGNATGIEIYDLSEEILQSVATRFGVTLEREVNII